MKNRVVILVLALFVVSGVLAYAQTGTIEIGFPFMAGGKAFAAGKYTVEMPNTNSILIRGAAGSSLLMVITTMGRRDQGTDLELVFDKIGDKSFLSEVWFPEKDGALVLSTKEAHQHAVAGGKK